MTVFVSHSFSNQPEFDNVAEWLEQVGVDYWRPADIKSADSLRDQLRSAIATCSVCIFVATRHSVESSWCGAELGAFWGAGVPIIVYLAEPSLPEALLPPILQGDVWERRLSRVANRAKELVSAARDSPGTEVAPTTTRIASLTVGQLELLVARAIASTGVGGETHSLNLDAQRTVRSQFDSPPQVTSERRLALLEERPNKWEYALFSLILLEGRDRLQKKWQDHEDQIRRESALVLNYKNIGSFPTDVLNTLQKLVARLNEVFGQESKERALGAPGEVGNPAEIERMAQGLLDIYEEFLDWSSELRGAQVSSKYVGLVQIAADLSQLPVQLIRAFIADFAQGMEQVMAGESVELHLTLKLDLDSEVLDKFIDEYKRVM